MGTYLDHSIVSRGDQEWDSWEIYEQNAVRHALVTLVEAVTDHTHQLEWRLDPLAARLHRRHCNDDCTTGQVGRIKEYWRTPEGMAEREKMTDFATPVTHPEMWDTKTETYCGRQPLCLVVDLKVYYWVGRGRRRLGVYESTERRPLGGDPVPRVSIAQRLLKKWER